MAEVLTIWVLACFKPPIVKQNVSTGPLVIKLFSCSTQLSMEFILLINVKMSTIVGILTFISRINDWLWLFKPEIFMDIGYFDICEQLKLWPS